MNASLRIKGNRYYAVICYKDSGKFHQKWISLNLPSKNNKRKAEALLEEIKNKYTGIYSPTNGNILFTDYIKLWLKKKKPLIQLSTWEGYEIYALKHIIPYFEPLNLSVREIKPKHIKEYYDYKYTSGRLDGKPGGLSIASIKKHSIVLKEVLNDAMIEEYITRNPAIGVKLPAKETQEKEKVFLSAEDAKKVLKAFKGHMLEPLVYVTLYYGLRRSEVLGLKWDAVDFTNNTIEINHTVVKNLTIEYKDTTKTDTSRHTYVLLDNVKKILIEEKERKIKNKKIFGEEYNESDYVFTWPDGKLIRPDYITREFQKVLKKNNIPIMRFHDLRHSTASILYEMGWGLKDIQTWMRHSSIEVTGDIYTHIGETRVSQIADSINEAFV